VENLLDEPRAKLEATVSELPLSVVAEVGRRFLPQWDSRIDLQGVANGHLLTTGPGSGVWGDIQVRNAVLRDTAEPREIRFSDFPVVLQGHAGSLGPLEAFLEQGAPVQVTGRWDTSKSSSQLRLNSPEIPLPLLFDWAGSLGVGTGKGWIAVLGSPRQGTIGVRLNLTGSAGTNQMSGSVSVSDASFHLPGGLRDPVMVSSARLDLFKNRLEANSINAALGPLELRGSLAVDWMPSGLGLSVPHESIAAVTFRLEAPEVDMQALGGLFPSPQQPSVFSWFAADPPAFPSLAGWPTVRGTVETSSLRYGGLEWKDVAASLSLHDQQVEISRFTGTLAGGTQQGNATIDLFLRIGSAKAMQPAAR
jgi:hypothetical protein